VTAWPVVVAAASLVVAALMVGLWLGERGRRKAAEAYLVHGSPTEGPAEPVSRVPVQAEDRYAQSRLVPVSKETVERFLADAEAQLRAEGIPYDPKQLRHDIEHHLMFGEDVEA
jgi:negative regulator of sigma E activity